MKQKDIILILVIAFISGIASFVVSNMLFAAPKDRQQKVEVVEAINPTFQTPSKKYFNSNSNDPTQLIQIGASTNPDPFNGTTTQ